jgi:hypothetical protein
LHLVSLPLHFLIDGNYYSLAEPVKEAANEEKTKEEGRANGVKYDLMNF